MEEFDENSQRTYDERQSFEVLDREAEAIIRELGVGDTLVTYDGPEGELQEEMQPEEASRYWSDALGSEPEGGYDGELPDPSELGVQFDDYGQIAPVEVTVHFDDEEGMGYVIDTVVDHDGQEADLSVTNTNTLGDATSPGELGDMVDRLGDEAGAFETVRENVEW